MGSQGNVAVRIRFTVSGWKIYLEKLENDVQIPGD